MSGLRRKSLNGILFHLLVEQGKIDLCAPVNAYLPELKETATAKVSVENLLHHRYGLCIREYSHGKPGIRLLSFLQPLLEEAICPGMHPS
jgi:CubicO group peptidase (beta-lactamase class C family)